MNVLLQSIIRHLLTAVGGALVAKYGVDPVTASAAADASAALNTPAVVGALSTVVGLGLSIYDKRKRGRT